MAEEAQAKVQTSVKNFVNEVDRNHLRKMEKEMHECAARCCSNNVASMNEVQACVEKCSEGPRRAQQMVQAELQRFQQALDRCVAGCQDKVRCMQNYFITTASLLFHKYFKRIIISTS